MESQQLHVRPNGANGFHYGEVPMHSHMIRVDLPMHSDKNGAKLPMHSDRTRAKLPMHPDKY